MQSLCPHFRSIIYVVGGPLRSGHEQWTHEAEASGFQSILLRRDLRGWYQISGCFYRSNFDAAILAQPTNRTMLPQMPIGETCKTRQVRFGQQIYSGAHFVHRWRPGIASGFERSMPVGNRSSLSGLLFARENAAAHRGGLGDARGGRCTLPLPAYAHLNRV